VAAPSPETMADPNESAPETRCPLCGAVAESTCQFNGATVIGCRCVKPLVPNGGFVLIDMSAINAAVGKLFAKQGGR
jgi:hypothetical protein